MSDESGGTISFGDGLPVDGVKPGTTLSVAGSEFGLAEELAISMVLEGTSAGDGAIFISNGTRSDQLLEDCARLEPEFDPERVGIVDCTDQEPSKSDHGARVESVSNSGDLTGIGIKFSSLYETLGTEDARTRTGFIDVSTLLMYADLRTVFRFLHTIQGRTSGKDGLLVLVVNPSTHDDRTFSTLMQLCQGRIEVRTTEGSPELRVNGLPGQEDGWVSYRLQADPPE